MGLMNRFPIIVLLGAGLLGYTAGEMIAGDSLVNRLAEAMFPQIHYILLAGMALLIVVLGIMSKRAVHRTEKAEGTLE